MSADSSQCHQPQELPRAPGVGHTEPEEEPPHQMDELSASLDDLNVTSLPEASNSRPKQDYNLVNSLLTLTKSPVSPSLRSQPGHSDTCLK